ncbi:MAG: glycerate kinase [Gammaproteobacteria bacterium]
MKIVIAPDSFKESLDAPAVAKAIEKGLERVLPGVDCVRAPLADGGEGTVEAVVAATGGRRIRRTVRGPLGEAVTAVFGLLPDGSAVIEMAAASGLPLIPPARRNPLKTTSYGTGQLIRAAVERGARRIVVGIGGSATNDCGAGMAQALGAVFRDERGRVLTKPLGGGDLAAVASIELEDLATLLAGVELLVACDVRNPLCGPRGASAVFGPQKGASPAQITLLDAHLQHFGRLLESSSGRRVMKRPGAGAAGGLGAALMGLCGGRLVPGVELVMELVGLDRMLDGADLVITGEGRIDAQTAFGKTPAGVARLAQARGVPVVGLGGALSGDARDLYRHGFAALEAAVAGPQSLAEALLDARVNLERAGERIGRWLLLGKALASGRNKILTST